MNKNSDNQNMPVKNFDAAVEPRAKVRCENPPINAADAAGADPVSSSADSSGTDSPAGPSLSNGIVSISGAENVNQADASSNEKCQPKSPKAEISSLEQFIVYAYGRKGKPLKLKPKTAKIIAKNSLLGDNELLRLMNIARSDVLLAVPRQLLLLTRDIDGLLVLRKALISFVSNVMLSHPIFRDSAVQAVIRNLPDSLAMGDVMTKLMDYSPAAESNYDTLKVDELSVLQNNAQQLFATWLAIDRGFHTDDLSSLMFHAIWLPAARQLPDETSRLRSLTDIVQAAGVGLVCQRFQRQADDARAQQVQAQREALRVRELLVNSEAQLADTREQRDSLQTDLSDLRINYAAELDSMRRQHAAEMTHLRHELEQLHGRLTRRLTDSINMLEVGLSALRKDPPRVPVMLERAEHVVDAIRAEIKELED
jgi:hypothetical protein